MLRTPTPYAVPPRAAVTSTCPDSGWVHVNVTDFSPGADLWPAWTGRRDLVYSSTTDDPLGDIHRLHRESSGWSTTPEILTAAATADTQPAVGMVDGQEVLAYTTTQYSRRGTVAAMPLGDPGAGIDVVPDLRGTSEAAWSSDGAGTEFLAFTSRQADPDGDVWAAAVDFDGERAGSPFTLGVPVTLADAPGVAETHPAWVSAPDDPETTGVLSFTARDRPADVADVRAEDGSERRVLARRVLPDPEFRLDRDEGAPTYSPDGDKIVYSSELTDPWPPDSGGYAGRELRMMDSDGGDNVSLAARTDRGRGDVDVDPAWSHDGTRIAWTRYTAGSDAPQVWIADLDTGTARRATGAPPTGWRLHDLTPSWSPNDEWLVVARQLVRSLPVIGASVGPRPDPADTRLTLLRADASGDSISLGRPAGGDVPFPVLGRTPAWSPGGTRIAFSRGPQLEYVELPAATPPADVVAAGWWQVSSPRVLVGFEQEGGDPVPTAAREFVEAGDDPEWLPDDERLLFSGQPAGQPDLRGLYVIGADGSFTGDDVDGDLVPDEYPPLADDPGPETEPAWQPREADVGVTVSVSGSPAAVGATVTARFTVTNHGPGYAPAVSLAATYGAGATTVAGSPPAGCAADGTGCAVPLLAPGATFDYEVAVAHPGPIAGAVARGTVTTSAADPVPANDTAQAPYDVVAPPASPSADLAVTVAVSGTPVLVGAPLQATFTVTNLGPSTAEAVTLSAGLPAGGAVAVAAPPPGCASDGTGCTLASLAPGGSTSYVVDLAYPTALAADVTATVLSSTPDPQLANNTASIPIEVIDPPPEADLAVTLTLDGPTGWVGGRRTATVVVRNQGPDPAGDARLDLSFPDVVEVESSTPRESAPACDRDRCSLGTLEPGARLVWTVLMVPSTQGVGAVTASVSSTTVDPELQDNAARERLTVLQPRVSVLPGVSRPGKAVLAFGEDMPPGSEVVLSWSKGIMTAPGPYLVEPDGTFTQPVFVLRRDRLGVRRLTVRSASDDFSPVGARLLVTYPTMVAVGEIEDRG